MLIADQGHGWVDGLVNGYNNVAFTLMICQNNLAFMVVIGYNNLTFTLDICDRHPAKLPRDLDLTFFFPSVKTLILCVFFLNSV